jgi:type I restriction enzyme, S subunit
MRTWTKQKLGDLAEIVMGQSPESKHYNETGDGLPFFQGVKDFGEKYPSVTKWTTSANKIAFVNDILFSVRAPVGDINMAKVKCALGRGVCAIRSKNNQGNFLYFLLRGNIEKIMNVGNGAIYDSINKPTLENMEFLAPNLPTQTRIASVLSAYDDLIENNEKRIKALEEMAQLLYTEWFVKFKFPGHKKVKMVDSGTKYDMVPEGWEVVAVGDLLETVKRKAKLQTSEYQITGQYPIVDQGIGFIAGYTDDEDAVYNENIIVFGDHSRCFKYCNFSFTCGADGTQLLKTNDAERMPQILLYYAVINVGLQNYNYARHFKFLKALTILKPDSATANAFDELVNQTYEQIKQLKQQNINAGKTRDLLIPQLVTGKRELK